MFESLTTGEITLTTCILGPTIALIFGAIGGAIGGIIIGGEHLGKELAAMMGGFFGPIAAVPGVLVALIILYL